MSTLPQWLCCLFSCCCAYEGTHHCGAGQEQGVRKSFLPLVLESWFGKGEDGAGHCVGLLRDVMITYHKPGGLQCANLFSILEARALRSRWQQGHAPSEGSKGEILPCLFQFLVAPGISWLAVTTLQSLLLSSHGLSVFLCVYNVENKWNLESGVSQPSWILRDESKTRGHWLLWRDKKKSLTSNLSQRLNVSTFIFSGKIPIISQMLRVPVGQELFWVLGLQVDYIQDSCICVTKAAFLYYATYILGVGERWTKNIWINNIWIMWSVLKAIRQMWKTMCVCSGSFFFTCFFFKIF